MLEPITFAQAVGIFLTSFRQEHELTLDEIAQSGRKFGMRWSASSVRNIETGQAAPTLQNLLALGLALNEFLDHDKHLSLADLLGGASEIAPPVFADGIPPTRAWIDQVLSGGPIYLDNVNDLVGGKEWASGIIERLPETFGRLSRELPDGGDLRDLSDIEKREPSLAESRAAESLGIQTAPLRAWAQHLWGRSLEEESAARAEKRSTFTGKPVTPQTRGAMTRALIAEIRRERAREASQQGNSVSPS